MNSVLPLGLFSSAQSLPISNENGRRKTDHAEFLACKPPRLVLRFFFSWMEVLPLDGSTVLCT